MIFIYALLLAHPLDGINDIMTSFYANSRQFPLRVGIVLFEDTKLIDVTGPLQVFNDAKLTDGIKAYDVSLVSESGGPVITDTGISLETTSFNDCRKSSPDTLLVSGGHSALIASNSVALQRFLRDMSLDCRRLGSICIGAFILAASGLLDGRRATTHWENCEQLRREYPSVKVEKDAIFIEDSGIWTSAGVTTGIDMALSMVEQDLGRAEALRLAKSLVLFVQRMGGQSQFSSSLKHQTLAKDDKFDSLISKVMNDLSADWSVTKLAAIAHMSERNFSRVFTQSMGESPARFIEALRVERACEKLQNGEQNLRAVAHLTGFGNMERMRRAFQRLRGVSPKDYGARFGKPKRNR